MRNLLIVIVLWGLLTPACLRPKFEELEFVEVRTDTFAMTQLGVLTLRGKVLDLKTTPAVNTCGFVWSLDEAAVAAAVPTGQVLSAQPPAGNEEFSAELSLPEPGQRVFFRAFATLNHDDDVRRVYGAVRSFDFGQLLANVSTADVQNDRASIQGLVLNLASLQTSAEQHGHVWSAIHPEPTVGVDSVTKLGPVNDDNYLFTSHLNNLRFNTTYTIRPYLTAGGRTFYGPATTFDVLDGWREQGPFQPYQGGSAVALKGKVYVGFGCAKLNCASSDLDNALWQFDPAVNSGAGGWTAQNPLPDPVKRRNVALFALGDTLYLLGGDDGSGLLPKSFWKYVPNASGGQWWEADAVAANAPKLSGAVVLTLGNRAFVGTGSTITGGFEKETNRFWEYDPTRGTWREVAPLPLQRSAAQPIETATPRADAVAFALDNGYGYVGGGQIDGTYFLSDFWRFTPPAPGSNDPGVWESVGFCPAPSRLQAVALGLGNRGFYGCGRNETNDLGLLSDWWEFNPNNNQWEPRVDFQGGRRRNQFAFVVAGRIFAGGGIEWVLSTDGSAIDEQIRGDVWEYVPR